MPGGTRYSRRTVRPRRVGDLILKCIPCADSDKEEVGGHRRRVLIGDYLTGRVPLLLHRSAEGIQSGADISITDEVSVKRYPPR